MNDTPTLPEPITTEELAAAKSAALIAHGRGYDRSNELRYIAEIERLREALAKFDTAYYLSLEESNQRLRAEADTLREQVRVLREALAPLAAVGEHYRPYAVAPGMVDPHSYICDSDSILLTVGDALRALTAYGAHPEREP